MLLFLIMVVQTAISISKDYQVYVLSARYKGVFDALSYYLLANDGQLF